MNNRRFWEISPRLPNLLNTEVISIKKSLHVFNFLVAQLILLGGDVLQKWHLRQVTVRADLFLTRSLTRTKSSRLRNGEACRDK